jgi:hypothetical protein
VLRTACLKFLVNQLTKNEDECPYICERFNQKRAYLRVQACDCTFMPTRISALKPTTVHLCPPTSLRSSLRLHIHAHAHLRAEAYNCASVPTRISKLKLQLCIYAHAHLRVQACNCTCMLTNVSAFKPAATLEWPRSSHGSKLLAKLPRAIRSSNMKFPKRARVLQAIVIHSCNHFATPKIASMKVFVHK